jgi:hypothetical protein
MTLSSVSLIVQSRITARGKRSDRGPIGILGLYPVFEEETAWS